VAGVRECKKRGGRFQGNRTEKEGSEKKSEGREGGKALQGWADEPRGKCEQEAQSKDLRLE